MSESQLGFGKNIWLLDFVRLFYIFLLFATYLLHYNILALNSNDWQFFLLHKVSWYMGCHKFLALWFNFIVIRKICLTYSIITLDCLSPYSFYCHLSICDLIDPFIHISKLSWSYFLLKNKIVYNFGHK